jgi:hypothetical protein
MTVHKKLMQARVNLQKMALKKSGFNSFSNYKYFELGDFLPQCQEIFNDLGLCGYVSFNRDCATMQIIDTDDGTVIVITTPTADAPLKGTHPIQQVGAIQTYQRRYLWMAAMEIVEHDAIDSSPSVDESKKPVPPKVMKGTTPAGTDLGPWAWKITASPNDDVVAWVKIVKEVASLSLSAASAEADVVAIFRVNKSIIDQLKLQDESVYDLVMAEFKVVRQKFKEPQ